MSRFRIRPRAERKGDDGFTLVELLCSMFLFAVVLSIISSATISMLHSVRKQQGQADNLDGSRKALELLDRQVRYASAITQPGTNSAGTAQYVEFQTGNAATAAFPNPTQTCYQWRLNTVTKQLQYRSWSFAFNPNSTNPTANPVTSGWNTQLTGAVVLGTTPVFATSALAVGVVAPANGGPAHPSLTVSFGAMHGVPSTTTANTLTLSAVDTTSVATAANYCTPTTIDGSVDRP